MAISRNSNPGDNAGPYGNRKNPPRECNGVHIFTRQQAEARRNMTRFDTFFIFIKSLSSSQFDLRVNLRLLNNVYRIPDSHISSINQMVLSMISGLFENQHQIVMAATIMTVLYFTISDDEWSTHGPYHTSMASTAGWSDTTRPCCYEKILHLNYWCLNNRP